MSCFISCVRVVRARAKKLARTTGQRNRPAQPFCHKSETGAYAISLVKAKIQLIIEHSNAEWSKSPTFQGPMRNGCCCGLLLWAAAVWLCGEFHNPITSTISQCSQHAKHQTCDGPIKTCCSIKSVRKLETTVGKAASLILDCCWLIHERLIKHLSY